MKYERRNLLSVFLHLAIAVPLVLHAAVGAETMTPQELTVRAVYAQAVLASRVHGIMEPFSQASEISVRVRDVRTGLLADILNTPFEDLVTLPSGRVLEPALGNWSLQDRHLATYVQNSGWMPAARKYGSLALTLRGIPFSSVLQGNIQTYSSWVALTVVVSASGEEREYKALFLFRNGQGRDEAIKCIDYVLGGPVLDALAKSDIAKDIAALPESFAEDHAEMRASARKLRDSVQGRPQCIIDAVTGLCCAPATGECGLCPNGEKR